MFLLITGLALVVRVAFALTLPDGILWTDGVRYERVAGNLLEGRGFGSLRENERTVPTLPLYLAATYAVAGRSHRAARVASALLGALTCGLAFLVGGRLFGIGAGVLAGLILTCYPYYIYISGLFEYPTILYITLVGAAFLFLPDLGADGRARTPLLAGLFVGLAILTIPTALLFVPLAVAGGFALRNGFRRQLLASLLFLCGVALPVGAWAARNYLAYDTFMLVNNAGKQTFWMGNNPFMYKYRESDAGAWIQTLEGDPELHARVLRDWESMDVVRQTRGLTATEAGDLYFRAALGFIRERPGDFLRLAAYKFVNLWQPDPKTVQRHVHATTTTTLVGAVTYFPVALLAIAGVVLSARRWRRCLMIYLYVAALTGAYTVIYSSVRYRLPIDFFLAIFAGLALARAFEALQRRHGGRVPAEAR